MIRLPFVFLFGFVIASSVLPGRDAVAGEPWAADSEQVKKLATSQPLFLYEESKVTEYVLPDPLLLDGGNRAVNAEDWSECREQTIEKFRAHMYGRRPDMEYTVKFETLSEKSNLFGIEATGKSVKVEIKSGNETYSFPMLVFIPKATNKLPAIVHIDIREFPTFESASTKDDDFWPVKEILSRGYVACAVSTIAIDPDRADGFSDGLRGFFHRASGKPDLTGPDLPGVDAWKALSAWGWGASRAIDFLHTLAEVDPSKIAVIGHSRGGKAALWAAAEDPRFAIACSNNSGCGGAALSRRAYGETVARITTSFPYWFCDRFSSYAGRESEIPVDQHQLFGLIAPRPVYATSAGDDLWADPRGEYLAMVAAAPVYKLLEKEAITNVVMPSLNETRIVGQVGYHIRPGKHGLWRYDWIKFIDFCDTHFVTPTNVPSK